MAFVGETATAVVCFLTHEGYYPGHLVTDPLRVRNSIPLEGGGGFQGKLPRGAEVVYVVGENQVFRPTYAYQHRN